MPDLSAKEYIKGLSKEQLRQKWIKFFKSPPPEHLKKSYIVKQLIWCLEYSSISKDAQKTIDSLVTQYAKNRSIRVSELKRERKIDIKPGTKFIREYKSIKYEVTVVDNGYSYNDKVYKSITAVAKAITGTGWNGKRFFGVDK